MSTSSFSQRLDQILKRMAVAAASVGRSVDDVTLIGVSKRKPIEDMQLAYSAGLRHFGENRAQEVRDKFAAFSPENITRHFIGHLQSNKVKYLPGRVDIIHTVDSTNIADQIDQKFGEHGLRIAVLVEVNISGESSKEGVGPEQAFSLASYCLEKPNLEFKGLMTIGPLTDDQTIIRQSFRHMRLLNDDIGQQLGLDKAGLILSMGMSGDFEIAIEEGASHIRVGTALFGEREY
ncbi:MAG: YggS family pyridoxal phosphate-dependent enzyme [Candidatus Marinimicrobia bacterium]|nr:YggS family pyridoxal phosphate-dependent enzyme [Candidatus Neomarinimicrobiota bacterium]